MHSGLPYKVHGFIGLIRICVNSNPALTGTSTKGTQRYRVTEALQASSFSQSRAPNRTFKISNLIPSE